VSFKSSGQAIREDRMERVKLVNKLAVFTDHWKPKFA
jgi:hypothetical protein